MRTVPLTMTATPLCPCRVAFAGPICQRSGSAAWSPSATAGVRARPTATSWCRADRNRSGHLGVERHGDDVEPTGPESTLIVDIETLNVHAMQRAANWETTCRRPRPTKPSVNNSWSADRTGTTSSWTAGDGPPPVRGSPNEWAWKCVTDGGATHRRSAKRLGDDAAERAARRRVSDAKVSFVK